MMLTPIEGGIARNLTPGIPASPSSLSWNSAERISVVANVDGNSGYSVMSTAGRHPGARWEGWVGEELIGDATQVWVPSASFFATVGSARSCVSRPKCPPKCRLDLPRHGNSSRT